jgi:hypothetical protein
MSDCLDSLRDTLSGLDDKEITQALRDIEALSRRTHAVMLDMVAEIDSRGIAGRGGFGTTQRLVAATLRLSTAEARARVEHASMVGSRHGLTPSRRMRDRCTLSRRTPQTPLDLSLEPMALCRVHV